MTLHTSRETALRVRVAMSEGQLEPLVLAECGRLARATLYPTLYVWKNEVGLYVPKTDAFAAVDETFRARPAATAADVKSALARRLRSLGDDGSPDIAGEVEGVRFWIELKRPACIDATGRYQPPGELQDNQIKWHAVARERRGQHIAVIDDPIEVEPFLRRVLQAPRPAPSPARLRWTEGAS